EGTYDTHTWLGAHPEGDAILYYFHGLIGQVRVSKTARYDRNFTPAKRFVPDNDTRALYLFDEGKGDKLTDSSGNNHHGKIVGAKWVKADRSPIAPPTPGNYMLQFEGTGHVSVESIAPVKVKKLTIETWVIADGPGKHPSIGQ